MPSSASGQENLLLLFLETYVRTQSAASRNLPVLTPLEKGAVNGGFSVLVGLQLPEKRLHLCCSSKPPSAVDRAAEEMIT